MKKTKKSQITTHQVFYILLILIFCFVLLLGYAFVKDIRQKGDKITRITLKTDIETDVNSIGYGGVKMVTYKLPTGTDKICFTEPKSALPLLCPDCGDTHPILTNAINDKASENVFLIGDSLPETMKINKIATGCCEFLCINAVEGKVRLRLEDQNEKILVKGT